MLLTFIVTAWVSACAPASYVRVGLDIHVPANTPEFTGTDSLVIGKPSP